MDNEKIARIAHQINKAYCEALGDYSQPDWKDAPLWQKESAIDGVLFHQKHPEADASASHENWLLEKIQNGWTYGEVKDADKKQHPCLVPFKDLPQEQRAKDYLFKAIVSALSD